MPKPQSPEAETKAFWNRLGAPLDPKDYDLSATGENVKLADALRGVATAVHLPKDTAAAVAAAVTKHLTAVKEEAAAETAATMVEQKKDLQKNWGKNFDLNMQIAKLAVGRLGVKPEAVEALEKVTGYAFVMDLFRTIGEKIGEDKFFRGPGGTPGVMTREQALEKKAELKADTAWVGRFIAGGSAEKREMAALDTLITGE